MPVTPFHGGVGLIAKGLLGRRFSFATFCVTHVVIDCETGYYLLRGEWPVHRFFHSFVGATLVCSAVVLACRSIAGRLPISGRAGANPLGWIRADFAALASRRAAVLTGAAGVLGHVVPDGIMHSDIRPFAPVSAGNPLFGVLSLSALHLSLIASAFVGAVLLILRANWRDRKRT